MATTEDKVPIKCKYYNRGYCRNKSGCKYYHPTSDCQEQCSIKDCRFRHRNECRYKQYCYHYRKGQCEFIHNSIDSSNVPLATDDNQKIDAHQDILAEQGPNYEDQYKYNEDNENLKILNNEYKVQITDLENKLNEEIKKNENAINKINEYRNELKKEKQKNVFNFFLFINIFQNYLQ